MRGKIVLGLYLALLAFLWASPAVRGTWPGLIAIVVVSAPAVVVLLLYCMRGYLRWRHPGLGRVNSACDRIRKEMSGHGPKTRQELLAVLDEIHRQAARRPGDVWLRFSQLRAMADVCKWAGAREDDDILRDQHQKLVEILDAAPNPAKLARPALPVLERIALDLSGEPAVAADAFDRLEQLAQAVRDGPLVLIPARREFATKHGARLKHLADRLRELAENDASSAEELRELYEKLRDGAGKEPKMSLLGYHLSATRPVAEWAGRAGHPALLATLVRDIDEAMKLQPEVVKGLPDPPSPPIHNAIEAVSVIAMAAEGTTREHAMEVLRRLVDEYPSESYRYDLAQKRTRSRS